MEVKNETDQDACPFGIHLAMGATVTVSDDLDPAKIAYLQRNFTVIGAGEFAVEAPAELEPAEPAPQTPQEMYDAKYTRMQLIDIARERGTIDKYYTLTKAELIEALTKDDESE